MSINGQKIKRNQYYSEYIRDILINRNIDCDDSWWETEKARSEIEKLAGSAFLDTSNSLKMGMDTDEKMIFLGFRQGEDKKILESLVSEAEFLRDSSAPQPVGKVLIVCFVHNMKSRIYLEELFLSNAGKDMKKQVKKIVGHKGGQIPCVYMLDQDYGSQDIKLKNIDRFNILQMPLEKRQVNWESDDRVTCKRKGYELMIDLHQLVEIYNTVGDRLFKRNLRHGLNEQMGVDQSIKETLENSPELFWFKNNGVTILVERPDFKLDGVGEILLESIKEYGDLQFSVINGAQTITASAEYFYSREYALEECGDAKEKARLQKKLEDAKKAFVSLKIIHIPSQEDNAEEHKKSLKEVNDISVALNRQKPIKAEDIAFASPFVEKMVEFLERQRRLGTLYPQLVKRGEGGANTMELIEFARARKACARKPGDARSKGANALLGFVSDSGMDYHFKDTEIFVESWLDADEAEEEEVFKTYYGAVNFAVKTAEFYEKESKKLYSGEESAVTDIILRNGKWYFTAYMVQFFNEFRPDFSKFEEKYDLLSRYGSRLIAAFAEITAEVIEAGGEAYREVDSNLFKRNTLFADLLKNLDRTVFEQIISGTRSKIQIHLNNSTAEADSMAEAMVTTVSHLLNHYAFDKNELEAVCGMWLTQEKEKADMERGYFRGKEKTITAGGETFWIGTSSNTGVKTEQMKLLCQLLEVKKGSISWISTHNGAAVFNW